MEQESKIILANTTDEFKELAYKKFLESGCKASFEVFIESFSNEQSWFNQDGTILYC